jgi:cyclic-di-GMP-binding protein
VVASENSFDIVSEINLQEVDNAVQQALKEIHQRYDFKGSIADIQRDKHALHLTADDDFKLRAVSEILNRRLAGRGVPLKGLTFNEPERATGETLRQEVALQQGIPQEQAKEIVRILKGSGIKVQASIMSDQVRVRGKNRDDLQRAIKLIRDSDLPIAMQFTNYR